MKEIREKIDEIDWRILKLISERFALLPDVLKYKIENNLPIKDNKREKEVIKDRMEKAKALGINPKFSQTLFKKIMEEARRIQKKNIK